MLDIKKLLKILSVSIVLVASVGTMSCSDAENVIDCLDICETVEDCAGDDFDVDECVDSCEDNSDNQIDTCDQCLDEKDSCIDCTLDCALLLT